MQAPVSAGRQERALPTATTMATISITSIAAARKVVMLTLRFTAAPRRVGPVRPRRPHELGRIAGRRCPHGQPPREADRVTSLELVEDLLHRWTRA
jgi:hypothetical protein